MKIGDLVVVNGPFGYLPDVFKPYVGKVAKIDRKIGARIYLSFDNLIQDSGFYFFEWELAIASFKDVCGGILNV